jgi:antitoxin component YwqK of YwqJK toxin-antitoxin module
MKNVCLNLVLITVFFLLNVNIAFSQNKYPNGQIKERLKKNINGELNGEQLFYYENGQLERKENYINGNKNGQEIWYYENGQISMKENFVNGKANGEYTWYYPKRTDINERK